MNAEALKRQKANRYMIPIPAAQIGGARVQRTFTIGDRRVKNGDVLTGDEVRSIRHANRTAFIDKGYLVPWPIEAVQVQSPVESAEPLSRFVAPRGFGKYDVIEGRKLNEAPLSKEEAQALAGIETPANGDQVS